MKYYKQDNNELQNYEHLEEFCNKSDMFTIVITIATN